MNIKSITSAYKSYSFPAIFILLLMVLFSAGNSREAAPGTIAEYEPALAVRASGCLTCHAEIYSSYITDFGYGSSFFFGNPAGRNKVGPFNGNIYGDFTAEPGKTSWLTAEIRKSIIVPRAEIDFNLGQAADAGLKSQASYKDALKAGSLAQYLQSLENQKDNPAEVIEKKKVFIGAPDSKTLEKRFGIAAGSTVPFKYLKNNPGISTDIQGIQLSNDRNYYTNLSEIHCDGDLFIRGILFLDNASVATNTGCRIYATGPIFLQGPVTFRNTNPEIDRTNLQLVSSEAIFLGVGRRKCNAAADSDPLSSRLLLTPSLPSIITRTSDRENIPPRTFAQNLYDKASMVPLEDSSCHDATIGFTKLLLNAPVVHSRYSGRFKGLLIAEFALFWQGRSSFEFDPVFKDVSVLPLLEDSDYLVVE